MAHVGLMLVLLNNWAWRISVIYKVFLFYFAKLNIGFDLRENRVTLDFCDTEESFLVFKIPCSLHIKGQKQQLQEEVTHSCPVILVFFGILPFPYRLKQSLESHLSFPASSPAPCNP
jgi:hypothetical protein